MTNLKDAKCEIRKSLKTAFGNRITALSEEFEKMDDNIDAPHLSSRLFKSAEHFISTVQTIELSLHNFERELYKYKLHVYKANNEGRAKIDASVGMHPWWGYRSKSI